MKKLIVFIFLICFQVIFSQNTFEGIVVDSKTLKPIEFVDVYSKFSYTTTNIDGRFEINLEKDSLVFRRLGYDYIKFSNENIVNNDTIRLTKKEFKLDEVVIKNDSTLLKEVFSEIKKNYPFRPYKEFFFLRAVLKKDGRIVKLQDLYGKLERQTLFGVKKAKKNYTVELLNMRKVGIEEKKYDIIFFSFIQLLTEFTVLGINPKYFYLDKKYLKNSDHFKMSFTSKNKNNFSGYYIVNNDDKSVKEFYSKKITRDIAYINKFGIIKYRTIFYELIVAFKKNLKENKYYIDKAKINATLEVLTKKETKPILYDLSYIMTTKDHFGSFEVDENVSSKKDIFRIKYPYDHDFWKKQKTLLLTDEMLEFLDGIENSEYKIKTNLN